MTGSSDAISWPRRFAAAWRGIRTSSAQEPSLKVHLICSPFVIGLAALSGLNPWQWAVISLSIGLVITSELLNTAIEAAVDLISPEHSDLARIAKDAAAGAVLVAAFTAVVVGLLVFVPVWWTAFAGRANSL